MPYNPPRHEERRLIVECPRCRARYRVESDVLVQDQTFKCSRCSHIFAHEAQSAVEPETAPQKPLVAPVSPARHTEIRREPARHDAESLAFTFSSAAQPAAAAAAESRSTPPPSAPRRTVAQAPDYSFDDEELDAVPSAVDDEPGPDPAVDPEDEPRFVRGEDDLRVERERAGSTGRPYFVYLSVLVMGYAILTLDLVNHPARAEKLLASVPMAGRMLSEDHLLQTRIQLQDVEGVYQQIKEDRLVFIVSGRAVNTSNEPLKGVQIESTIVDASNHTVEAKSIYCGNAMSLKIVKDLSPKEISLLQRLEPTRRFEIRPGESAGFSVVFLNPPRGLKEFTARVAAAQPSTT
jgi:predicted Zn finger-like uncharacterized protein